MEKQINLKKEPQKIKNLSLAYSKNEILIAINADDTMSTDISFVIPAKSLKDIVTVLFECGVTYQKETGKDIGFGLDGE